jgi:hypothetical protein
MSQWSDDGSNSTEDKNFTSFQIERNATSENVSMIGWRIKLDGGQKFYIFSDRTSEAKTMPSDLLFCTFLLQCWVAEEDLKKDSFATFVDGLTKRRRGRKKARFFDNRTKQSASAIALHRWRDKKSSVVELKFFSRGQRACRDASQSFVIFRERLSTRLTIVSRHFFPDKKTERWRPSRSGPR